MKKALPVVVLILILGVGAYWVMGGGPSTSPVSVTKQGSTPAAAAGEKAANAGGVKAGGKGDQAEGEGDNDSEGLTDQQDRPAAEVYKTADEALAAIKQAALSYDDLVLEQFTQPGEDCTWCDQFYTSIREMMLSPEVNQDQRSYFAEVLAVSGRVENVKALVDAIKSAPNNEQADAMAEALELSVGKDDVVNYLGEQLNSDNDLLKESAVAAITNQGSRLAVDLLYKNTVDKGDPDGYYSQGIGLGELVPEEDAMPKLQEIMLKRDQYSHLAVKSLLNAGAEGLKLVFDALANSKNPDFDREMLKGSTDHVSWDEDTMAVVEKAINTSKDPLVQEYAKQIKQDLKPDEESAAAGGSETVDGGDNTAPAPGGPTA
jgi:hypothetical protein